MTVDQLFEAAWHAHWDNDRFHKSGHAKEVYGLYHRHIQSLLGGRPAVQVTPGEVRRLHAGLSAKPTTANRCLEVISRMYNHGLEFELITGINPCTHVRANVERKRERYADTQEIGRLCRALEKLKPAHPTEVAFIQLLLLTGARPRAIARAKLTDLRINSGTAILVFDGKSTAATGLTDVLAIPEAAMRMVVDDLPHRLDGLLIGNVTYRHVWNLVLEEAGVADLWLRDLRRTFATVGLSHGLSLSLIGELLNHHSTQTTARYAKLLPEARAVASNTIAAKILGSK
jgi:integrase